MAFVIRIGLSGVRRTAGELRTAARELERDLTLVVDRVAARTAEAARGGAPRFQGILANSIVADPAVVHVVAGPWDPREIRGAVKTATPYAVVMEEGRKAGKWPPLEPIRRWVDLKLKRGDFDGEEGSPKVVRYAVGRPGSARRAEHDRRVASLTFLVRRAIARRGIKGRKFMGRAAKLAERWLFDGVGAVVARWLRG